VASPRQNTVSIECSIVAVRHFTDLRAAFGWVPVHEGAYARAWEVQGELTALGQHRGAGPVDLVIAATAELFGLALLHHDRDFATIAGVTGQALRWYGPD
jgi:predicted nucleic acid-binding protein